MVYLKNFVAVVKVNGKILREDAEGNVYLPYGSEYELMFKNLNTQRAVVRISIDGQDILDDNELVINPNSDLTLKRFLKENDNGKGPRFKFIKKTDKISNHRGDRIDDGIIRIEYQFERKFRWEPCPYHPNTTTTVTPLDHYISISNDVYTHTYGTVKSSANAQNTFAASNENLTTSVNTDSGITVGGSDVHQDFKSTSVGILESDVHVICMYLRAHNDHTEIKKPITIKRKTKCSTCGKTAKSHQKFCGECGTNLNW